MQSFSKITPQDLINSRVLFGHLSKKWNPKMKKFILMKKNNLHILDPNKTLKCLAAACTYAKGLALAGKKILFVGTKQQAKSIVAVEASKVNMPYVTERWLGGTLTNFIALRKLIKKWQSFERLMASPTYKNLTKKEQLTITREKDKLGTLLGGLVDVSRLPAAIFVVDINRENIAVKEAMKLGIPVVAIVDTNSDPDLVDVPIPANDDSVKSIDLVVCSITSSIHEGLQERLAIKSLEPVTKESDRDEHVVSKNISKVLKSEANKPKSFASTPKKTEGVSEDKTPIASKPKARPMKEAIKSEAPVAATPSSPKKDAAKPKVNKALEAESLEPTKKVTPSKEERSAAPKAASKPVKEKALETTKKTGGVKKKKDE